MTREEKIESIASYGFGVYSFPGGYAIADHNDDEDGWFLSTCPINCNDRPTFDQILEETCLDIAVAAVEGPLAGYEAE
jgi:hypothetical protein